MSHILTQRANHMRYDVHVHQTALFQLSLFFKPDIDLSIMNTVVASTVTGIQLLWIFRAHLFRLVSHQI